MLFSMIPEVLVSELLTNWCCLRSVAFLDTSCCNKANRVDFLFVCSASYTVWDNNTLMKSDSNSFMNWVASRRLKFSVITVIDNHFDKREGKWKYVNFDWSLVKCATFLYCKCAKSSEIVKILKQTNNLTSLEIVKSQSLNAKELENQNDLFFQKLKSIRVDLNGSFAREYSKLIVCLSNRCSGLKSLKLHGRGFAGVESLLIFTLYKRNLALEYLELAGPTNEHTLALTIEFCPALTHLMGSLPNHISFALWNALSEIISNAAGPDVVLLVPVRFLRALRSLSIGLSYCCSRTVLEVPDKFFTSSFNLLSLTLGRCFVLSSNTLLLVSMHNPQLMKLELSCVCDHLSEDSLKFLLQSCCDVQILTFHTALSFAENAMERIFCSGCSFSLRKLVISECLSVTAKCVVKILKANKLETFVLPRHLQASIEVQSLVCE